MASNATTKEWPVQAFIIESLSGRDVDRHEGMILTELLTRCKIECQYDFASDGNGFARALTKFMELSVQSFGSVTPKIPILHISSHGSENGLQLGDRTEVAWRFLGDLTGLVRPGILGSLIVCMSSCHGYTFCRDAFSRERFQFFAIVGPTARVQWADALVAYVTFYHHQFNKGHKIDEAVRAMNIASGAHVFDFMLDPSAIPVSQLPPEILSAMKQPQEDLEYKLAEFVENHIVEDETPE
jgi:hypothetical protein